MASCPFSAPASFGHTHGHSPPSNYIPKAANQPNFFSKLSLFPSTNNLHRSFRSTRNSWSGRCHATGPQSSPPPKKHSPPPSGVAATFARLQDTLQIFLAVLFWMSLFFWSCAWDGRNNGRRDKGSRFRK